MNRPDSSIPTTQDGSALAVSYARAAGYWTNAWRIALRRPLVVAAVVWVGAISLVGVMAPFLANGHPIVLRAVQQGTLGPATFPLLGHLTAADWILAAGLPVATACLLWPAPGGRERRVRMLVLAIVQAALIIGATHVLRAWSLDRGAPAALASWARREWFVPAACAGIAALIILAFVLAPGPGGAVRRAAAFGLVGAGAALATAQTWRPLPDVFDYLAQEREGRAQAIYTIVPWSPAQRPGDRNAKLLPPGSTHDQSLARAVLSSLPGDADVTESQAQRARATIASLPLSTELKESLDAIVAEATGSGAMDRRQMQDQLVSALAASGRVHALGTDAFGQDVLSQLIHACRLAISIGLVSTGIAVLIGVIVGAIMGYFGGIVDLVLYRVVEVFMAVPLLFVLIVAAAVLPRNIYVTMAVIGCFTWMGAARFTRAEFLRLRGLDFVLAARAIGAPVRSILFRHMLPNGIAPVLVDASFGVALAIVFEATLSFLGLGAEGQASWGRLLADATSEAGDFVWWLAVIPGGVIFLTALAFNLIGEALRDAVDPRLRHAGRAG